MEASNPEGKKCWVEVELQLFLFRCSFITGTEHFVAFAKEGVVEMLRKSAVFAVKGTSSVCLWAAEHRHTSLWVGRQFTLVADHGFFELNMALLTKALSIGCPCGEID